MNLTRKVPARLAACLLVAAGISGCRVEGAVFRTDERLTFLSPEARQEVSLPLTVSWRWDDEAKRPARFALVVDTAPPAPGKSLESLVDDPGCRAVPDCVRQWFPEHGVYETTETSFVLEAVARRVNVPRSEQRFHELTIVLLDEEGRRTGEANWSREFFLPAPTIP
jgi:hypothetical protein